MVPAIRDQIALLAPPTEMKKIVLRIADGKPAHSVPEVEQIHPKRGFHYGLRRQAANDLPHDLNLSGRPSQRYDILPPTVEDAGRAEREIQFPLLALAPRSAPSSSPGKSEAVNFPDHGISRHAAEAVCDLRAAEAVGPELLQEVYAIFRPSERGG
jgi:hypothetical protein